ncbi:hypothetical protein V6N12_007731 [Hibiscus sabdariffa]|uniref:DUF4283 domain-containing protein n=1 Tax=Hibiscus sabdariffa TaxID=183260 RepID=A0ABR2F2M7_9ROSI
MDIKNNYFLVTFRLHLDFLHVLTNGPWLVFGHYLTVEPWTTNFSSAKPHPSKVMAWIRLPGLPITLYKRSLISEIGDCIGRVIKLDYQTEGGRRCRFARMAVSVDLSKPLISKCGTYGHARDSCPSLVPTSVASPKMVLEQNHDPHPHPFDPYGPWMVVDRRQRRPQKNHATPAVCSLNKLLTAAKGKTAIHLKTKTPKSRVFATISNASITIGGPFHSQASSSKQHPQTRTPHAIIHLDRSKHSAIIFIDGPDSKLPATSSAPSISPPGPTEPLDNHFLPSSQPTGTKIPCDNASDLTDLLNCSMDH